MPLPGLGGQVALTVDGRGGRQARGCCLVASAPPPDEVAKYDDERAVAALSPAPKSAGEDIGATGDSLTVLG
jgi:hypothetical protein